MLHERICRSEKLARISAEAERCWTRILVLADDNGNIEYDLDVIRAHGFVKRAVLNEDVQKWVRELIDVRGDVNGKYGEFGLLAEYEVGGRQFLHVVGFEAFQMLRADRAGKLECPPHPPGLGPVRFDNQRLTDGGHLATSGSQSGDTWQPLADTRQPPVANLCQADAGREVEGKRSKDKKERASHPALRPATEFAFKTWQSRFQRRPNWQAKDWKAIAGLFSRLPELTVQIFERYWRNYLASTERFIAKQGYGLAYFCSKFDSFIAPQHDPKRPGERKSAQEELAVFDARRKPRDWER